MAINPIYYLERQHRCVLYFEFIEAYKAKTIKSYSTLR